MQLTGGPLRHRQISFVLSLMLICLAAAFIGAGPSKADDDSLDLQPMVISAEEAGVGALQFTQAYEGPLDVEEILGSDVLTEQRIADLVLKGWDSYFDSTDGRVELNVRLIEFQNHHWATTMRSRANAPTPEGFPADARLLTEGEAEGRTATSVVKGRLQAVVLVRVVDGATVAPAEITDLLRHVATIQLDQLPMTPDLNSSTKLQTTDIRAWLIGLQIASVPVLALLLALAATLRDFGTLERYFPGRLRSRWVKFDDLTPQVRAVRRQALRRVALQLAIATLFGAVAVILQILVKTHALVNLAFIPLGMAVAVLLDAYLSGRRSDAHGASQARFPILVGAIGAMVIVYAVAFAVSAGIAVAVLFNPVDLLIAKVFLVLVAFALGVKALSKVAVPLRWAKQLVQADVTETLKVDPRQEVLLLRSFQDDSLTMRMHRSARHSAIELASAQPFERFEELLAWSLWRFGPVFAIGQPTTEDYLQPLGAAREFYTDDTWQAAVHLRMQRSSMVVFVVGRSGGLYTEFVKAQRLDVLGKCLFVFPPVNYVELRQRLAVLEAALGFEAGTLPAVDARGRRLIGLYFDDDGSPIRVGVDGRDDFSYQTLFTVAAAKLVSRTTAVKSGRLPGPDPAVPEIAARMVSFDPWVQYNAEPKVWWGFQFVYLSLRNRRVRWEDETQHVS